jgi:DNA-binding MarR family transcriptional regulator
MFVLKMVQKKQSVTIQNIANHLKITMPTTSVLLDKLEKNDFIQRIKNPKDKRSTLIKLSPKAKKTVNKLIEDRSKKIKLILSYLAFKDKQNLFKILNKLSLKLNSINEKK